MGPVYLLKAIILWIQVILLACLQLEPQTAINTFIPSERRDGLVVANLLRPGIVGWELLIVVVVLADSRSGNKTAVWCAKVL